MTKNADRGQATRHELIRTATELFAALGYDGTSIEAVLKASGVSRGSLYHHFDSKEALFEAVLEGLADRIGAELSSASGDTGDAVDALRAGFRTWIRLAGDPTVQQIMLTDAPSVLGWQRFREFDEQHTLGNIRAALTVAAGSGRLNHRHVDAFAHILLAAANEIAILVARADDPVAARLAGEDAVDEFLRRLLGP